MPIVRAQAVAPARRVGSRHQGWQQPAELAAAPPAAPLDAGSPFSYAVQVWIFSFRTQGPDAIATRHNCSYHGCHVLLLKMLRRVCQRAVVTSGVQGGAAGNLVAAMVLLHGCLVDGAARAAAPHCCESHQQSRSQPSPPRRCRRHSCRHRLVAKLTKKHQSVMLMSKMHCMEASVPTFLYDCPAARSAWVRMPAATAAPAGFIQAVAIDAAAAATAAATAAAKTTAGPVLGSLCKFAAQCSCL